MLPIFRPVNESLGNMKLFEFLYLRRDPRTPTQDFLAPGRVEAAAMGHLGLHRKPIALSAMPGQTGPGEDAECWGDLPYGSPFVWVTPRWCRLPRRWSSPEGAQRAGPQPSSFASFLT